MHPPSGPSKVLPWLSVAFCVCAWGSSFVAARHLLHPATPGAPALDPVTLAAARFSIASLFFAAPFAVALVRRRISGRDLLRMALLGQIAFSVYFWLQYTGVSKTNAGISAILAVGLLPSATALMAPLAGERRPPAGAWAALLLGFLGVAAIALDKPVSVSGTADFILGALCLVANAFAFALYSLLNRRWSKDIPPIRMTAGSMIFGTLGLLAMSAATPGEGWAALKSLEATQGAALLFLSLACSVAGYVAWTYAMTRIEAGRATVWLYAEPVVAAALGWTVLGERYGWLALAGAAAIGISAVLATRHRPP